MAATPVTDGETLIAFFGSHGVYAYDLNGELLWKKDAPALRMRNEFGEGTAPFETKKVSMRAR